MRYAALIALTMCTGACGWVSPDSGTEAVLVKKPFIFGHGGIDRTPVKAGRTLVAISTQVNYVEMRPQRMDLEFDDLMTKDGVPLDFHAVISMQVTDSVMLIEKFANDSMQGFFARNLEQPFRTAVRDSVKERGLNEMAINVTAAEAVDEEVTRHLQRIIKETGVPIKLLDVNLGRANPPDAIKHQRIDTATQEQRIITEQQRKLAEDQRKAAEDSRAAADQAYIQKMGLNPRQYVELEAIKMQRDVCAAGGKCTFLIGGGVVPTLDVK